METVMTEAKSMLKLPEDLENLIKKEWHADKSKPIRR